MTFEKYHVLFAKPTKTELPGCMIQKYFKNKNIIFVENGKPFTKHLQNNPSIWKRKGRDLIDYMTGKFMSFSK